MKALFLLIALSLTVLANAQDLLWKSNFTGTGNNIAGKSAIDSKNNIYIIGVFNSSIDLPSNLTSKGANDIFLTKYDKNGSILWTRQIGGPLDDTPLGIAITPDDEYVYVTGTFQQTAYAEDFSLTSTGSYDGFLVKYRQNGDLVWIKDIASAAGNTIQRPTEIKIDKNNHLIIGGLFASELKLGTSLKDTTLNTTQAVGLFFAQLDTTGALIKAKKFESTTGFSRIYTFDTDVSGYYITGHFKGDLITDLGTYSSDNASLDMYVYKLDFNLESKWIMKAAGTADDQLYSCSVDNKGYFYVGGHFTSNILVVDSLPNGTLSKKTGINKTTNSKNDIFFAKYKHDGTLQWFNTAGSTENDYLYRALYNNGYFIAAGQYGATLTFRGKTITPLNTADAFAIIHTSSNNLVGLLSIGGTGNDIGETSLVDSQNNAIVIGDYVSSKIFFTPKDSLVNSNSGTRDMFVAKYKLNLLNIPMEVNVENPYRFKSTVAIDSILTVDSIVTQKLRTSFIKFNDGTSMTTAASGGSTIYAKDGLYKDGDTIKSLWVDPETGDITIRNDSVNEVNVDIISKSDDVNTLIRSGYSNISIGTYSRKTPRSNYLYIDTTSILWLLKPKSGVTKSMTFDDTGLFYSNPADTSLSTDNHLMTKRQVLDNIYAKSGWVVNSRGTKFVSNASGDSVVFIKGSAMSIQTYDNGSLRLIIGQDGKIDNRNPNANSAFGRYSQSAIISGTNNSTFGNSAGRSTNYGSFNSFFGSLSGDNNYNGNNIIGLGAYSAQYGSLSNRLYINSLDRSNILGDTTKSIVYGYQDADVANQRLYLNANVKVAEYLSYKGTYASICREESLGDTTVSVPNGSTPTIIGGFTTNLPSSVCVADKANSRIIINKVGMYSGDFSLSYGSGTNGISWKGFLCGNGSKLPGIWSTGYTATANDKRSTAKPGQFYVSSVPYYIDFRVSHDHASAVNLIIGTLSINVNYIGN